MSRHQEANAPAGSATGSTPGSLASAGERMSRFILQISAGSGPAEARTFVAQLTTRVVKLLHERGIAVAWRGPQLAAPRSVLLACIGAPAATVDLCGTHALVHAARGKGARRRWFAAVTLHAVNDAPATLDAAEIAWSATRAGGPGGQRVNKVASAVRAVHSPSGIAVRVAGERSQRANRRVALTRIAEQLREREVARAAANASRRHAAHRQMQRGGAICTYRLVDGELRLED